jgi:hypothetical protein
MGENGRRYVKKEASIEAIGLKMKQILQALIVKRESKYQTLHNS